MQALMTVVLLLQVLSALAMIGLVLVQHGKGADMGASFGSGASGSLFGATGSANFLSRSTAVAATLFFGCTLGLAFLSNGRSSPATGADTALDRAPIVAPAPAASGAAAIPGAVLAPVAPASVAASAAAN